MVTDSSGRIPTGEVLPYDERSAGWPFNFYGDYCAYTWFKDRPPGLVRDTYWFGRDVVYDIVIALVVVVYSGSIWERLLRRSKSQPRKENTEPVCDQSGK
jgi:hypothetical protein